jgi:hypothetical protein
VFVVERMVVEWWVLWVLVFVADLTGVLIQAAQN